MTLLSPQRLEEIRSKVQRGELTLPESGYLSLPDSPSTGLSWSGDILDLTSSGNPVMGSLRVDPAISGVRPESITSELFTSVEEVVPAEPEETPISSVTLPSAPPLGTEQTKESDLNKRIQRLQEEIGGVGELVGREELEIKERGRFGVEARITTQESIYKQLLNLKAQTENLPSILQQQAEGRGITTGGLAPIQAGRLRQAGIQANILNAQFSAASQDLATAERQVRQAVQDAFGPKEAELKALQARIQSIKDSPEYTSEIKARADAAEVKRKAEEAKVAAAKSTYEDILKLTTQVTGSAVQDEQNSLIANQITDLVNTDAERLAATPDILAKAQALAQPYIAKEPTGQGDIAGRKGEARFTQTQENKGAATANLPISEFQKLDEDTQNFFINNADQIKSKKKLIDEAKSKKEDPTSIETEINTADIPEAVKDSLKRYLNQVFPPKEQASLPWWKRLLGFVGL